MGDSRDDDRSFDEDEGFAVLPGEDDTSGFGILDEDGEPVEETEAELDADEDEDE